MSKSIQIGQIWRLEETGENWLVTKTYSELFTSYAVLRKIRPRLGRPPRPRGTLGQRPVLAGFSLVEESV